MRACPAIEHRQPRPHTCESKTLFSSSDRDDGAVVAAGDGQVELVRVARRELELDLRDDEEPRQAEEQGAPDGVVGVGGPLEAVGGQLLRQGQHTATSGALKTNKYQH